MKYLFTNQNFFKSKLPLIHEFTFLKKDIYFNKGTFLMFDILYFLLSLTVYLDHIYFNWYFITYSIVA